MVHGQQFTLDGVQISTRPIHSLLRLNVLAHQTAAKHGVLYLHILLDLLCQGRYSLKSGVLSLNCMTVATTLLLRELIFTKLRLPN